MEYEHNLIKCLERIFGYKNYLNELQTQAVINICEGKRDIFIRGYGKSLTYQLPVMVKDNAFIVVITCRISYMKHYNKYFTNKEIETKYFTSSTSRKKRIIIENDLISKKSKIKILFITPAQYETAYFKTILKQIHKQRLSYIVIDQAENILSKQDILCTQYQNLDLKIICVPIITVSATASTQIQGDIIKKFGLLNPKIYAMPVLRTNLYCDTLFINIIPDPMSHLILFIEDCLSSNSCANLEKEESWGLIVCANLEATASIAKFLTSSGIAALSYYFCSNKSKNIKNPSLKNVNNARVIVCEENDAITVTNNLVRVIAKKSVRFVVYWHILPNIEKYYLISSRARCFYEMSNCRIYCLAEELVNRCVQPPSHDDNINDGLQTALTSSLIKMQCRHKVYSDFFRDTFSVCQNYCDVCKHKEEVEEKIILLLEMADNQNLRAKLQETILEYSNNSNKICDENLQYKHSQQTDSSDKTKSNINLKQEKSREHKNSSLGKHFKHEEVIFQKDQINIDKKKEVFVALNKICDKNLQYKCLQQTVSSNKTKSNVNLREEECKDDNSNLDKHLEHDEVIRKKNEVKIDKKKEALLALDKVYSKIFSEQPTQTLMLTLTQSSNVTTISDRGNLNVKTSKKSKPVIAIDNKHQKETNLNRRDDVSYLDHLSKENKEEINTNKIYVDKKHSSNKVFHCNNRLDESGRSHYKTKIKTIEIITIDEDETTEEEYFLQNKANISKKIDNDTDFDDIIFVEEAIPSNRKRYISTSPDSKSFKRTKRRKVI